MNKRLLSPGDFAPLLPKHPVPNWKKKMWSYWHSNGVVLLILLWHFSSGLVYKSLLQPSAYLQLLHFDSNIFLASLLALIFLVLSPLAGFIADVKCGRFSVLMYSSYLMLMSLTLLVLACGLLIFTVHQVQYYFYILFVIGLLSLIVYICGRVFFLANILQLGTDQLRDAPTSSSMHFLMAYYWCDNLGNLLTLAINIPRHDIHISVLRLNANTSIDRLQAILFFTMGLCSTLMLAIVIFFLQKNKSLFTTVTSPKNPYKLVYNVLKFAVQHKKPIRRSAFTYWEDEIPSRLDFAKQRFGGPFTTEQVEDVRVFFGMLKVLISLTPVFLLDLSASSTVIHFPSLMEYNASITMFFINNGVLSPLLAVICLPLYLVALKPLISRFIPNMFKRMGLGIVLLTVLFTFYFIWDVIGTEQAENGAFTEDICKGNNRTSLLNLGVLSVNYTVWFTLWNITSSLTHAILYIAIWEFICCQSPQYMKGLVFGLFYAMRATWQLLAVGLKMIFYNKWRLKFADCQSGYHLVNLIAGLICFIMFTVATRRYKYRKRDDICNVYKYAEDYYSNIQ